MNQKRLWFAAGFIALPFIILAILVAIFAVNVPVADQWELVGLFKKYHQGGLGFSDFFAQHNEHRLLFPRLLMLALAIFSHWNVTWEMAASLVLAAISFIFIYLMLSKTLDNKSIRWAAALVVSCIFFSPIQWENWLWGWQLQWYLNILGLVVAVWALSTWKASQPKRVLLAAAAATVATYSLGSGLFVWILCIPLFRFFRFHKKWLWLWVALGIAVIGANYIGYHDPVNSPAKGVFLSNPVGFVKYLLVYLSRPLALNMHQTIIIAPLYLAGICALLFYFYRYKKNELYSNLLPWICFGVYGCFAALETAVARLALGVEQAYSSRYVALSQLLLIMFVVLAFKILEDTYHKKNDSARARTKYVLIIVLAIVMLFTLINGIKGARQFSRQSVYLHKAQHCAQTAKSSKDPCLLLLYPSPGIVWDRLQYLRSTHWGGL
ncbi:MAG TPA: hypothetical protein VMR45_01915 [Patescibacteria group bacterium]|nr:hypothetical protein [Patescibacteria group bacterium]